MNKKIRFLLLGDFRQLPTVLSSLVISHAKRLQINGREKRRLAPADALVVEYEARGAVPTNAPQTMRVWPGLRWPVLRGPGAAEAHQAWQRHHLRFGSGADSERAGRVWLYDVELPHFTLKHLYMGCSRATNSELLSVF
eukprot:s372_g7.t1